MAEEKEKKVLGPDEIERAVRALGEAIFKDGPPKKEWVLVGIARGGVPLAKRIESQLIKKGVKPFFGTLDITFYRDDIALKAHQPQIRHTEIPQNLDNTYVVLVDDVLYSGRTTRAALDALVDFGRPDVVRLAVLIDRGHRELPIHADFVGAQVKTAAKEEVRVAWTELGDAEDRVTVVQK